MLMQQPYLSKGISAMLGQGTVAEPYQIRTAKQLENLAAFVNANTLNGSGVAYRACNYVQTAHIDLSAYANFTPIGVGIASPFTGIYDGNGFTISNLTVTYDFAGLFSRVNGTIKNVGIESGTLTGTNGSVGSIACLIYGTVCCCYNKATLISIGAGASTSFLGGICGVLYSGGSITDCVNFGNIIQNSNTAGAKNSNGIAGTNQADTSITRCLAVGVISGSTITTKYSIASRVSQISNCYQDTVTTATAQEGALNRTTANCQGLDALTNADKLSNLGTSNWFTRIGSYPLPVKFNR